MIKKLFNLTKFIYSILICTLVLSTAVYPATPMPGMPNMSEAEMQKFMGELENTAKEIDNFVSSLPPAEQEEFNKAVQEVEQMINDMSPEELEQFIGGMFGAPGAAQPQPKKPAEPEVPVEKIKVEETPKLSKKELSEQEKALDLLDTLIKRTESFMVKAQAMPELAGKTKRWAKKGRIRNWQADSDWSKVKTAIDRLTQKLHKMKDKDPKTKQYKFLKDFIENKALYNNLSLLRSNLDQYEPVIEVSAFGIEKISPKAKSAIQQLIGSFTESLYVLKTPEALNKIIAKYEPRAKELTEEEKKIETRAIEASKRGPRAKATVVGGTPESEDFYGAYGYGDDYSYNGGYNRGYESDYQPSAYSGPSYTPSSRIPSASSTGRPSTQPKTKAAKAKKYKTPTAAKTKKVKKEKGKPSKIKAPKFTKEMATAETYLDEITDALSAIVNQIDSVTILSGDIKKNLAQVASDDTITESTYAINNMRKKVKDVSDYISRIKLKAKTPALRKAYKQRLENIFKEIKVDKKKINPKAKLDKLLKTLENIEKEKGNIPVINQYAYFGGMSGIDEASMQGVGEILEKEKAGEHLTADETAIKEKYSNDFGRMQKLPQTSFYDLRKTIKDLLDAIKNFDKEKKNTDKKSSSKK